MPVHRAGAAAREEMGGPDRSELELGPWQWPLTGSSRGGDPTGEHERDARPRSQLTQLQLQLQLAEAERAAPGVQVRAFSHGCLIRALYRTHPPPGTGTGLRAEHPARELPGPSPWPLAGPWLF